jgi:hypothetical protein
LTITLEAIQLCGLEASTGKHAVLVLMFYSSIVIRLLLEYKKLV